MKKLKSIVVVLLLLSVVSVGVSLGYETPDESKHVDVSSDSVLFDPDLHINVLAEPNCFPNGMSIHDAVIGGKTYEGAVVQMVAGRVLVNSKAVCLESGQEEQLPYGEAFACTLTEELRLMGGYTYFGYYRTEDGPFKRLPLKTDMAPITLELINNGGGTLWGNLSQGLSVEEDTTATLLLSSTYANGTPYYECGQYQFHIVAVKL